MKTPFLFAIILMTVSEVRSQSSQTTIEYNKTMQPALRLELANSPENVKTLILKRLKLAGHKPETTGYWFWKNDEPDGFYVFTGVILPSMTNQKLDMYFKIASKDNSVKDSSIVYMLVSTGKEHFPLPDSDTTLWKNTTDFFNGFSENSLAYTLEQDILRQENIIAISQKNLSILRTDEKNLEGRMKQMQVELKNNQRNQTNQQTAIDEQKMVLENLKDKRKMQ